MTKKNPMSSTLARLKMDIDYIFNIKSNLKVNASGLMILDKGANNREAITVTEWCWEKKGNPHEKGRWTLTLHHTHKLKCLLPDLN